MRIRRTREFPTLRIYVALGLMGMAYLLLLGALWRLQGAKSQDFEKRFEAQSLRRVRLPGIRGKIYDRNDLCLADNRPNYTLALFPEEIRRPRFKQTIDRAMEVIQQASEIIGMDPVTSRKDLEAHIEGYRPLPLVLWRDISPTAIARFAELGIDVPGIDIYTQAARLYPYSPYTSHLIGYVGEVEPTLTEDDEFFNYNLDEMFGRAGLEKLKDSFLRGEAGEKLVQVDVGIYRHRDLATRAPKRGGDLRLTLDMEVQLLAHQALGTNTGAVVVLDPNNGDVLSMVSNPGYDANLFVPYITSKVWRQLADDPAKPMLNRAVAGTYPPGSTFKPLVALTAALVDPHAISTVYDSPSTFRVGGRTIRTHGHGEVDMRQAIEQSANVYFFKTALACGWQTIIEQSLKAGLGRKTGVEVDYEASGFVPNAEWMRKTGKGGWTDGDTCNLAIGQGYLLTTPLQMAMLTATIANGGILYKPRLVQATRAPDDEHFKEASIREEGLMNWSQTALTTVRGGMRDVISGEKGTARSYGVDGCDYAAKTGTAEYWDWSTGHKEIKNHAWMIAYAPFHNPQYAIAFVIEDGDSGGRTVGPYLKILIEGLFQKLKNEGRLPNSEFGVRSSGFNIEGSSTTVNSKLETRNCLSNGGAS
jgi:penicillin-binding protein 2